MCLGRSGGFKFTYNNTDTSVIYVYIFTKFHSWMKQQWKFGQLKVCSKKKCIQRIISLRWLANGLGHNSNKNLSMRLDDIFSLFPCCISYAKSIVILVVGKKITHLWWLKCMNSLVFCKIHFKYSKDNVSYLMEASSFSISQFPIAICAVA